MKRFTDLSAEQQRISLEIIGKLFGTDSDSVKMGIDKGMIDPDKLYTFHEDGKKLSIVKRKKTNE